MRKSRLLGLVAVIVLAAGGAATFAWTQTSDTTTINACVANEHGQVRIVKLFSLTYQKIEWTWVDSGVTASDDRETPVA